MLNCFIIKFKKIYKKKITIIIEDKPVEWVE
jgi:hypothetical protein